MTEFKKAVSGGEGEPDGYETATPAALPAAAPRSGPSVGAN